MAIFTNNFNDVSEAFTEWLQAVIVDRVAAGSVVNYEWVDGAASQLTIQAVVQNANPKDLLIVPEGLRTEESIKLHTTTLLRTVNEFGEENADVVNYLGTKWKVYNVANRQIGGYYKVIAIDKKVAAS